MVVGTYKTYFRAKGFLVIDNATSHAGELAGFIKMIEEDVTFETVLLAFQREHLLRGRIIRSGPNIIITLKDSICQKIEHCMNLRR